jgi:DNA-binding NarL/FixJ family response regulator
MYRSRILIADDHTLVAELCKKVLETEFDVVGTVTNGRALVRAASELKPDVIIVDIAMPVLNGLDAAWQVKDEFPAVNLIFLTMTDDVEVAAEAFRRGASGYLLKTCAASQLVTAVRDVLWAGRIFHRPSREILSIPCDGSGPNWWSRENG